MSSWQGNHQRLFAKILRTPAIKAAYALDAQPFLFQQSKIQLVFKMIAEEVVRARARWSA